MLRMKHDSPKTEKAHIAWIKRYLLYHHKKHQLPEIYADHIIYW